MDWKKVQSTKEPLEVDTESSKTVVYLRRNIEQKSQVDSLTGDTVIIYYEYEEREMAKSDYYIAEEIINHNDQEVIDVYTQQLMEEGVL